MKFRLLQNVLTGIMLLVGAVVYSQTTVSGQVITDEGPVPGVNVIVKGTTTGAATDFDGNYTIENVPSDAVLEFSFIGYVTQSVPVNGRSRIDVSLASDSQALEEVVVIGYGTVKKSDATGAVEAIGAEDFSTANANSPAQILRGKVAGVQITQASGEPGGSVAIRVRGNSSLRSGNNPLIVVDGVPLSGGEISAGGSDAGLGTSSAKNPLNFINQNDIETINILKDASSTAIYGSRGANGVILITTKKGKAGKPVFEFSSTYGVSDLAKSDGIDMMSSEQYAEQAVLNGAPNLDHGSRGYNYEDDILRSAVSTSYDFSAGFSGDGSRTRMAMGIVQQEGIVKETGMDKYSFSLNNSLKAFNDRVSFDTNVLVSHIKDEAQAITDNVGFIGSLIGAGLYWNPTYPIYNDDGSYFQAQNGSDTYINPVELLNSYEDKTNTTRILANISPTVRIVENLEYKFTFGVDYSASDRASQILPSLNLQDTQLTEGEDENGKPIRIAGGRAFLNDIERFNKTFENILTYKKTFSDDFSLNALLGYSYYSYEFKANSTSARYFNLQQTNLIDNMEGGRNPDYRVSSAKATSELQSFFARAEMVLWENLLVNASIRYDGSSKVGEDNTYGTFPAVGVAYKFFENNDGALNFLKLRANWGIVGNSEFAPYSSLSRGEYQNGALVQQGNSNADLKWETTTSYGVGLDFRIFENVSGSADYFFRSTEDLIFPQPGASNVPNDAAATTFINLPGQLENSGFEFALNWDIFRNDDWSVSVSGNVAFLENEMKDFPLFIQTGAISGQGLTNASAQIIANNLPIYTFYLNEWRGFDEDGNSIYAAPDGSDTGLGGAAKVVLDKTGLPDVNYGFNINAGYKNFDFNAAFYGVAGGYIYNNTANALFFKGSFLSDKNVPLEYATTNQAQGDPNSPSTRYLESGDFLRMANMTLGYNFTGDTFGNHIDRLRLYVAANNLFVITDYTGFDPEVDMNKQINGVNSAGMDYYSYPASKGWLLGVTIGF